MISRIQQLFRIILIASVLLVSPISWAQEDKPDYQVKASQIPHFINAVEWPGGKKQDVITICLLGESDIAKMADALAKYDKFDFRMTLVKIKTLKNVDEQCQALIIGESEQEKLETVLTEIGRRPILTISDIPSFIENGGMIGYVPQETDKGIKTKFAINKKAIEATGLSIKADVVGLAIKVIR